MAELTEHLGQTMTILLIAVALGMDAFSLCVGIGMKGIRLLHVAKISVAIAAFHVVMPLVGLFMGQYVSTLLGDVAVMIGGGLLVILGAHMIYSSLRGEDVPSFNTGSLFGLLAFALSVSVDSLSVGVSLGMFATDLILTVLLFGAMGGLLSVVGLLVGRRVGQMIGEYGETFGGAVLLLFGILFLI
ncbi:manganese efflux pump MntP family protein [Paenibacillus sp.]|uniref:manganese efflux pump MntP n=1 Tax=Paenibacillus sp. TaxID=58172 RepID=UPI002D249C0A|nr:manganese efflux pump [Paenibacillus sp.]HZG58155.1 manganese efflux pump [Paenibacillus sp.]